jgi:hypothetical protein
VTEGYPVVVILLAEVWAWACKGGVIISGIEVIGSECACGLVMLLDLAEVTKEDLILDPIIVWEREGICKLPILIQ